MCIFVGFVEWIFQIDVVLVVVGLIYKVNILVYLFIKDVF